MAILGGTGLGLTGILQGQQIAQNNFGLLEQFEALQQRRFDQNVFGQLVGQGFQPTQAFGQLAQNSPIIGSALQNTGRGLSLQQALLPQALVGAQNGDFRQLNALGNALGPVGNFDANNFNLNAANPFFGAAGVSAAQNNIFTSQLLASQLGQSTGATPFRFPDFNGTGATQPSGRIGVGNLGSFDLGSVFNTSSTPNTTRSITGF